MFGVFRWFRQRIDCRRLRRRAIEDPYPRSWVALCRRLLASGRFPAAMEAARAGLARFPHSDELGDVLRHTWRKNRAAEIERLRQAIRVEGESEQFASLARVFLECEEYDEALNVAEELSRRNPDEIAGWLYQGLVLLERFHHDHVAEDAARGIARLKHVLEIDGQCFEAHEALMHIYHDIGAVSKALFHLYRGIDIRPADEAAHTHYETLSKLQLENEDEATLIRRVEEGGRSGGPELDELTDFTPERHASILRGLIRLSMLNGVSRAVFVVGGATLVAEEGDGRILESGESDSLSAIALGFHRAASISARRMGIGAFQSAVLHTGARMVQCHAVGNVVTAVESDDSSHSEVVKSECADFVASCLTTDKELVHE